jgi:hypothetical protein
VHFLCLTCRPDALRARIADRDRAGTAVARTEVWVGFNDALIAAAKDVPTASVLDAGRTADQVGHDVRRGINARVHHRSRGIADPTRAALSSPG